MNIDGTQEHNFYFLPPLFEPRVVKNYSRRRSYYDATGRNYVYEKLNDLIVAEIQNASFSYFLYLSVGTLYQRSQNCFII